MFRWKRVHQPEREETYLELPGLQSSPVLWRPTPRPVSTLLRPASYLWHRIDWLCKRFSRYFLDVLQNDQLSPDCQEVQLLVDGTWKSYDEDTANESNNDRQNANAQSANKSPNSSPLEQNVCIFSPRWYVFDLFQIFTLLEKSEVMLCWWNPNWNCDLIWVLRRSRRTKLFLLATAPQ